MAKLLDADKLRGGLRRVYVSFDEPDDQKFKWVEAFWNRLSGLAKLRRQAFAGAQWSKDPTAGALRRDWMTAGGEPITDFVAVLTDTYVNANIDGDEPASGELATFIDRVKADEKDQLRVFLAP